MNFKLKAAALFLSALIGGAGAAVAGPALLIDVDKPSNWMRPEERAAISVGLTGWEGKGPSAGQLNLRVKEFSGRKVWESGNKVVTRPGPLTTVLADPLPPGFYWIEAELLSTMEKITGRASAVVSVEPPPLEEKTDPALADAFLRAEEDANKGPCDAGDPRCEIDRIQRFLSRLGMREESASVSLSPDAEKKFRGLLFFQDGSPAPLALAYAVFKKEWSGKRFVLAETFGPGGGRAALFASDGAATIALWSDSDPDGLKTDPERMKFFRARDFLGRDIRQPILRLSLGDGPCYLMTDDPEKAEEALRALKK